MNWRLRQAIVLAVGNVWTVWLVFRLGPSYRRAALVLALAYMGWGHHRRAMNQPLRNQIIYRVMAFAPSRFWPWLIARLRPKRMN
jgi:hypothetical protein